MASWNRRPDPDSSKRGLGLENGDFSLHILFVLNHLQVSEIGQLDFKFPAVAGDLQGAILRSTSWPAFTTIGDALAAVRR